MLFSSLLLASLSLLASAVPIEGDVNTIEARASGDTANDVDNKVCRAVTLIYARGSFESGNVGTLVGPPLITALQNSFGSSKVAAQGIAYPANAAGNMNPTNNPGIAPMVSEVGAAIAECPTTQIILGGYSQGGLVVHGTLKKLSASQLKYIKAVVLFGDEGFKDTITQVPASIVYEDCHKGDDICEKENYIITRQHLNYGPDTPMAAAFCKSKINA